MKTTRAFFRRKPEVIEAIQFTGGIDSAKDVARFVSDGTAWIYNDDTGTMVIGILSQLNFVEPGDWVIKGTHGNYYSSKPNIFNATYEHVSETYDYQNLEKEIERLNVEVRQLKNRKAQLLDVVKKYYNEEYPED